jgi:hypothetical protein
MHGNIYVATSPGRYRGIYIVSMADVYEGRHIGSIMRQVFTQPVKHAYVCVCFCVYMGNTTLMYVYICTYSLYKAS